MITSLLFHGIIFIIFLLFLCKWFDDSLLIDICMYGLLVELLISSVSIGYIYYCDFIFILNIGNIFDLKDFFKISLIFFFDDISNLFYFILCFALLLCFFFLTEYFEYDFNSTSIILLSSLFSQLALWFFCVYDLFLIIFFWESISIVSFFLIQYWSFRIPSYKASIKVFMISQLGDLPLFSFFFILIYRFNSTDLFEINSQLAFISFEYIEICNFYTIISFSFILSLFLSSALLLKSAQFFFYPWLLDAMEAPVPISAQLHSSTLVIIGFYIYFRFQNLIMLSPSISFILLIFGLVTVVCASILGFFQEDGKKLLACSTASQLGYVVVGLGLCYFEESMLMLIFCCCNKAVTFVWFGILMDRYHGISDMRIIGGIHKFSTLEHAGILVSLGNFTVVPGVFSWQIKSLYLKGQFTYDFIITKFCLDILLLTWFFASLYFFFLYISLFLKSCKLLTKHISDINFFKRMGRTDSIFFNSSVYFILISFLMLKYFHLNKKKKFISFLLKCMDIFYSQKTFKNKLRSLFYLYSRDFFSISWFFFFLLTCSLLFLVNLDNFFYECCYDTSYINNFFFFYDFFFYNFYNF